MMLMEATFEERAAELLALSGLAASRRQLVNLLHGLTPEGVNGLAEALKEQVVRSLWNDTRSALRGSWLILELAKLTGDESHRALGLRMKAQVLTIGQGQHRKALRLYERALAIHRRNGDERGQALVYMTSIWAMANLGQIEAAIQTGEWAANVLAEAGEWRAIGTLQNNLAVIYNRTWQYEKALVCLEKAREAFLALGKVGESLLTNNAINRAMALCSLGRFTESLQASQEALNLAAEHGQRLLAARGEHNLALTYFLMGHYNRSLDLLERSRAAHELAGQPHEAALCELSATDCLLQLGRTQDALVKCERLLPLFLAQGMRLEAAECAYNQAVALLGLGRASLAVNALGEARALFEAENLPHWAAQADLELARLHLRDGQAQMGLDIALRCCQTLEALKLPYESAQARIVAGQARQALGDNEGATRDLETALLDAERENWPYPLFEARRSLGQAARQQGDLHLAIIQHLRAADILERLRGAIMVEYRAGFLQDKEKLYADLVDLCLEAANPELALESVERARSNALLEMLSGHADLSLRARQPEDQPLVEHIRRLHTSRQQVVRQIESLSLDPAPHSHDDLALLEGKALELEEEITGSWHRLLIRNAGYGLDAAVWQGYFEPVHPYLDDDEVLIEYFTANNGLIAFVVGGLPSAEHVTVHALRLPVQLSQVERDLHSLLLNIRTVATRPGTGIGALAQHARSLLKRFYELLVAPLEPFLRGRKRLTIVPHGKLHYLPFHALYDGLRFLIESYTIRYLPASNLLPFYGKQNQVREEGSGKTLAVGHSFYGRLPYVLEEAIGVAKISGGITALETEANCALLQNQAEQYQLIHLACHAEFLPDRPLFSGLALDDGWLTTLDIFNLQLRASLVTLSACATGRSALGAGDEQTGLMRAFLSAGAATLVLSQWPVSDGATARLMLPFYGALADGAGKATALRQAQLQMLSGELGDGDYSHPYYWAPFFLVGGSGPL